jgi:hypothetical protein
VGTPIIIRKPLGEELEEEAPLIEGSDADE